jgi:hypothetical protein
MAESLEERLNRVSAALRTIASSGPRWEREEPGVHLTIHRHEGKVFTVYRHKGNIAYVTLGTGGGPFPEVLFRVENRTDRLGKWLGINREFHSGDAEFDAAVYIETGISDRALSAILAADNLRTAVMLILRSGADKLELDANGLRLSLSGKALQLLDEARAAEYADALCLARRHLPRYAVGNLPPARKSPGLALVLASALMFVVGFFGLVLTIDLWGPLDGMPYAVGCLGGWAVLPFCVPLGARRMRGYPDSFRNLIILTCLLFFALPLLGIDVVIASNGILDRSPSAYHPTRVLRKDTYRRKFHTTYFLEVSSWRPGRAAVLLKVAPGFYEAHPRGSQVTVTTRNGYWGWEWLEGHF